MLFVKNGKPIARESFLAGSHLAAHGTTTNSLFILVTYSVNTFNLLVGGLAANYSFT